MADGRKWIKNSVMNRLLVYRSLENELFKYFPLCEENLKKEKKLLTFFLLNIMIIIKALHSRSFEFFMWKNFAIKLYSGNTEENGAIEATFFLFVPMFQSKRKNSKFHLYFLIENAHYAFPSRNH